LDEYLQKGFPNERGVFLPIASCAIDSGYLQHDVTNFTREKKARNVFATKGNNSLGRHIIGTPTLVDVNYRGKRMKRGAEQYTVAVSVAKMVVHNRLRADAGKTPTERHFHFPTWLDERFYRGLCAEVFDPNSHRGWIKIYERNEPLDCIVLSIAAALHHNVRLDRYQSSDWARLDKQYGSGIAATVITTTALSGRDGVDAPLPTPQQSVGLRLQGGFMPTVAKVR
jgi:phage terminase large subunit GpA-like protein